MFIVHILYLSPVILLFVLVDESQEVSSTSCFAVKFGPWFYMAIVLLFVQIFICFITVFIMFKLIMKKAFGHCNAEFTGGVCKIQKKMYFSTIVQFFVPMLTLLVPYLCFCMLAILHLRIMELSSVIYYILYDVSFLQVSTRTVQTALLIVITLKPYRNAVKKLLEKKTAVQPVSTAISGGNRTLRRPSKMINVQA
uniref:G-protein coupled receptors family 1 profile domain-containing protein n=1 Tax=Acrobeloides nanus TaxID=290746 RepID=A0A914CHQ5_9BILA